MRWTLVATMLGLGLCGPLHAAGPTGQAPPENAFGMAGLWIGQPLEEARRAMPSLRCEAACTADDGRYLEQPGRLWVGQRDGRIDQLGFRFVPTLEGDARAAARARIVDAHGPPTTHLGLDGCDEWTLESGYLAVCLTDGLSHVTWNRMSRRDVNAAR